MIRTCATARHAVPSGLISMRQGSGRRATSAGRDGTANERPGAGAHGPRALRRHPRRPRSGSRRPGRGRRPRPWSSAPTAGGGRPSTPAGRTSSPAPSSRISQPRSRAAPDGPPDSACCRLRPVGPRQHLPPPGPPFSNRDRTGGRGLVQSAHGRHEDRSARSRQRRSGHRLRVVSPGAPRWLSTRSPTTPTRSPPIRERGGITSAGVLDRQRPDRGWPRQTSPRHWTDAEVVLVVETAYATAWLGTVPPPHLRPGMTVVVCPGVVRGQSRVQAGRRTRPLRRGDRGR